MHQGKDIIQVRQLWRRFQVGSQQVDAIRGIDLTVRQNEFVAIMGTSGSGKSTLMNILGCLDCPSQGQYLLKGRDISQLDDDQLASIRNQHIGFVFQTFNLQARRNVLENIMLPLRFSNVSKSQAILRAKDMAKRVGLEHRMDHRPSELSGGQRQRVAIARALINEPEIILADEPTGNLDSKTTDEIMNLFNELHRQGQTLVLITHEADIAAHAQRIITLKDGQILKEETNVAVS